MMHENILQPTPSVSQNLKCYHAFMDDLFGCKICLYEKYGLKL
jgi:hypothetical protein